MAADTGADDLIVIDADQIAPTGGAVAVLTQVAGR
jgi:hypothetical protein